MQENNVSYKIKNEALRLGFSCCGFVRAVPLGVEAEHYKNAIRQGLHAGMNYLSDHIETRTNPLLLMENSRTVIVVLLNYFTDIRLKTNYIISRYALGRDYHVVIKEKLTLLLDFIRKHIPEARGRIGVDSSPVMEKAWAARAGLGCIGKNSLLIHPESGSFFFIGLLLLDAELDYDTPLKRDLCGNCDICIKTCPTGALEKPFSLNAGKCISYLTIHYKNELPAEWKKTFGMRIYGCDLCQEVCPRNKRAIPHKEPELVPPAGLREMTDSDFENMTEEKFQKIFFHSSVRRMGWERMKRNIIFMKEN